MLIIEVSRDPKMPKDLKKVNFMKSSWYLISLISNLKKSSEGNPIRGNLEHQPEIRNIPTS